VNGDDFNKEPHELESLDKRLYSRDDTKRRPLRFDGLSPRKVLSRSDWTKIEEHKETLLTAATHPSMFKKFFKYSLIFAVIAVLFAVLMFFTGGNTVSNTNIDINVLGNSFASGGEELPLEIEVVNKNSTALELADLFVEYDKGGDAGSGASHVRDLISIGTIGGGKTETRNIFPKLYGEEGSVKSIDFTLQYRIKGSNAIFVKKSSFPVTISSAPIALSVDGPDTISPNQRLSFTVKITSNSKNTLSRMLARVEYPSGFKFESADPSPSAFTNVFSLGDLAPGAERDIKVTGTVYGQDGEDRAFRVYVGAASGSDATKIGETYNSVLRTVALVKPFLGAHIYINGSDADQVPVTAANTSQVNISWANNLTTRLSDAEIRATISGNAVDFNSISAPAGFYDSSTKTIVWNKTTASDLGSIEPSDHGTLDFSFRVLPLWRAGTQVVTRPSIQISVSIKAKQPDAGGALTEVNNSEQRTAVVSSDLGFSAGAYYNVGPFSNTGPLPPKAGQPTTYTITWVVTNSANMLSDGVATTTLPTYIDWVGTTSPGGEKIEYDATTRTVRWAIGQVLAGAGVTGPARTASFQVRLNPSSSQVGSVPKLILDTSVTAKDTFTGQGLSASRGALSTRLDNDPSFVNGQEIVK
jgi:hypothetical protein